jgi:excisionase family DNA binding protein
MVRDHQPRRPPSLDTELSLLTAQDVAALLKVKVSWLYGQVEAGQFPVVRLGRQLRFRRGDVLGYLDDHYECDLDGRYANRLRNSHVRSAPGRPRGG